MHLVTGASGFLGRPLVERLAGSGARVRAMVHRDAPPFPAGVDVVRADLADAGSLGRAAEGCTAVFHLAGLAHVDDADEAAFRETNVAGTARLLDAALRSGVSTFVFASSVKAMGEGGERELDEEAPLAPATPYGVSKREAEEIVLEAGARTGLRTSVLRLPLVYGPGLKGNLAAMLRGVRSGAFPPPPRVPNRRSLVSAADAAQAIRLAATKPEASGRTYLVTDGVPYSTRDLYDAMRAALGLRPTRVAVPLAAFRAAAAAGDLVRAATGARVPFSSEAMRKLFGSAWYSNERIRRELGFAPSETFGPALAEALGGGAAT